VNGRMSPRGLGQPERPTGWKPHRIFAWPRLKDLVEVWQEHGRNTMLHTAKTQPAVLRSSERTGYLSAA
jgi:hypothetical protein